MKTTMTRDELRAADPQFAALADMLRGNGFDIRVSHYRFNDGREMGRVEEIEGIAIDLLANPCSLEIVTPVARGRK